MRKILFLLLILVVVVGCSEVVEQTTPNEGSSDSQQALENGDTEEPNPKPAKDPLWLTTEFKDVNSGETFKISDFSKPVILESFAVWCPTCTKQQERIKTLHEEIGDEVISISLDTDPNEDENTVQAHTKKYGFDWIYAVSPADATQSLIDQFGVGVVNAPSVPVIIICPGKEGKLLPRGIKSAAELKAEVQSC